jgi:hypothetical protein
MEIQSCVRVRRLSHPMVILHAYLPMKMEQKVCSETLAYKLQTSVNLPEESIQQAHIILQSTPEFTW